MTENLCAPMPQIVSTAASHRAERGTSLWENIMSNAESAVERHVSRNMDCVIDVYVANPSQPIARAGQSPALRNVIVVDPVPKSQETSNVNRLLLCVWMCICTKGAQALSGGLFPASNWFYYLFHCAPEEGVAEQLRREYWTRWEIALRSIARSWKDTQSITTSFLLVSVLAILQLDDVLNNRAICTLMAAAILLALASIISAFVYLLSKERFISRWKPLEAPTDMSFWRCIAVPLDFAIW
ncbi:hypothetical protein CPC08DRAFT_819453 [Agrocybe pediades]|nr:hypothetical protein CPC08DRAFT_819453 [Agrocybe pediades]